MSVIYCNLTAAVDLCKIGCIVDHKSDKYSPQAVAVAYTHAKHIVRAKINNQKLQHQRCSAHNGDINFDDRLKDLIS